MHGDAVGGLEHRLGLHRTGTDAGGVSAMVAKDRDGGKGGFRKLSLLSPDDIRPVKGLAVTPGLSIILGLAGHSTATAADTFLQVDDHSVLFWHMIISPLS
jgi:hypothetical protein